ncbi:hypothetical protein [Microbulbifer sp.]|uniref:hypothetical protein n=1 Tax=Microbulbifer sp. TaxID=1908541 RepID=UPI003F3E25E5
MQLKQVATISAGYPFRGRISEVAGSGVVAVQMKDVSEAGGVNWVGCTETELAGRREPDWLRPGDILFAARGSRNYAAQVCWPVDMPEPRAVAAPHFFVIRTQANRVMPAYLAWLLNQAPCQRYFEQQAEGSLTKSIRRSLLEQTPVVLPSIARQRAIIGLADALRRERQLLEQRLRTGERLSRAIASDLFRDQGDEP